MTTRPYGQGVTPAFTARMGLMALCSLGMFAAGDTRATLVGIGGLIAAVALYMQRAGESSVTTTAQLDQRKTGRGLLWVLVLGMLAAILSFGAEL